MLEAKTDNSSGESLFADEKPKANNRNDPVLDRMRKGTRQSHTDIWWSGPLIGDIQSSVPRNNYWKPLNIIQVMVAHASVASWKHSVELDSHADTCVVDHNCWVIHDHNRPVNVYSYNPKDGHKSSKIVDATVGYQDPQSEQKFILMINQAIHIWLKESSSLPHVLSSEWCACQWSFQVIG